MPEPYIPEDDRIDVIGRLRQRLNDAGDDTLRDRAVAEAHIENESKEPPEILKPFKDPLEKDGKDVKDADQKDGEKDGKELKDEPKEVDKEQKEHKEYKEDTGKEIKDDLKEGAKDQKDEKDKEEDKEGEKDFKDKETDKEGEKDSKEHKDNEKDGLKDDPKETMVEAPPADAAGERPPPQADRRPVM